MKQGAHQDGKEKEVEKQEKEIEYSGNCVITNSN
jgi:hypothetical protein